MLQVEDMNINNNMDTINKNVGFITLLTEKQKMVPFFEWHDTQVVLSYFRSFLVECFHMSVEYDGDLHKDTASQIALFTREISN